MQVLITAVQTCAITGDLSMDTGPAMEGFTGAFGTFNLKVSAPSFADDSKDDFASGEGTSLLSMIIPTSGGGVLSRRRLLGKSGGSTSNNNKGEEEEKDDSVVGKNALSSRDMDEAYLQGLRVALFDTCFLALMMVLMPVSFLIFGYPLLRLLFGCFCLCCCCCCRERADGFNPSAETLLSTFWNVFFYLEAMVMNTMLLGMSAITIAILKTAGSHPTNVTAGSHPTNVGSHPTNVSHLPHRHILFNHLGSPDMFEEEEEPVNYCKTCTLSCLGCIMCIICCGQNKVAVEEQDPDEEGRVTVFLTLPKAQRGDDKMDKAQNKIPLHLMPGGGHGFDPSLWKFSKGGKLVSGHPRWTKNKADKADPHFKH